MCHMDTWLHCYSQTKEYRICKKLTIRETRQGLSRLEKILAQEGEVTITRREKLLPCVQIGKKNHTVSP